MFIFRRHLDRTQRGIHLRGYRGDCAVDDGAVLEFNRDGLVGAFHEEPDADDRLVDCESA